MISTGAVGAAVRPQSRMTASTAMALLYIVAGLLSALCIAAGLRAMEVANPQTYIMLMAGACALGAGLLSVRQTVSDLLTDLGLRERAGFGLLQGMTFFMPVMIISGPFAIPGWIGLVIGLHVILADERHFRRLLAAQVFCLIAAQAASLYDDIIDYALIAGALVLIIIECYLLRMAFVLLAFEATFPLKTRHWLRELFPFLAILTIGGVVLWLAVPSNPLNASPRLSWLAPSLPVGAPSPSGGAFQWRLLLEGFFWIIVLLALIYGLQKLREKLGHQDDEELDLDYVSVFATEAELPQQTIQRKAPPNDARQKIIEAYEKFIQVAGTRALEKGDGETASEYQLRLKDISHPPPAPNLEELTTTFEDARYDRREISAFDAQKYQQAINEILNNWRTEKTDEI